MFKEDRFVSKCTVDKWGRPNNFSSKENYRKYYDLKASDESESEDDDEEEADVGSDDKDRDDVQESDAHEEESEPEEESHDLIEPTIKEKLRNGAVDYARGEGN